MRDKAWIAGVVLLTAAILPGISGSALAATQDVTTTWNVAQDTSFSVSFPATHTGIDFDPASGDFTNLAATDQTDAQWGYNVTNDGNVNIDVDAVFVAGFDLPTGVSEFRTCTASSGGAPSGSCWWWTPTNDTTNSQTIISALTPGSSANRWAWTTGSGVIAGSYTATYRLTSTAV
ncbi:MAG: hypothetical protein ACE5I4_03970 [Thermoplasmata archaeon]